MRNINLSAYCPVCQHHRTSNHHKALKCKRAEAFKDSKPDNSASTRHKYITGKAFGYLTT